MTTIRQHFEIAEHPNIPVGNKSFFCGMECEIEAVKYSAKDSFAGIFMVETDHSLRNNGLEFKSYPNNKAKTLENFKLLHTAIQLGAEPFSERTSIHVHVNMAEMEMSKVKQFILAYAMLEPLFFEFVGEKRQNNIFCVPLFYTYLPSLYKKDVQGLHQAWHKYTAFNIKPLGNSDLGPGIGTIEFRHMYGTNDVGIVSTWLTILEEFYNNIAQNDVDILQFLVDGVSAEQIAKQIVPTLVKALAPKKLDINKLCEDTILDVKLATGGLIK
jgi:hypothetical protein